LLIPLATVGIVGGRVLAEVGFSNGILLVMMGANLEPNPGFSGCRVAATFWSRVRSGWRSVVGGRRGAEADVGLGLVVVIRVVRPPEGVVLVVKIPADGLRRKVATRGDAGLLVVDRLGAELRADAVVGWGGVKVSDGIFPSSTVAEKRSGKIQARRGLRGSLQAYRCCKIGQTLILVWAAMTGQHAEPRQSAQRCGMRITR
jgi:hypothetical protein